MTQQVIPLVLVPGILCDGRVWHDQLAAVADLADATVAEHGMQDSLPALAQAILAAAPHRFAIAGHSMGGRIALEVYRAAPERVIGMALMDTAYHPLAPGAAGETEKAGRFTLLDKARTQGMRAMAQDWVQGMVHPARLAERALLERILDMIEARTPAQYAAQIEAMLHRRDAWPVIESIRCPTLVLCGHDDSWSPLARHLDMAAAIQTSVLVDIPNCGHMSTMEQPAAVGAAMRTWLRVVLREQGGAELDGRPARTARAGATLAQPAVPELMRAVEISTPGGPQVLRLVQRPVPALRAGEVLVRVVAAGVNRPDVLQRKGLYPPPQGASDLPGLEVSGEIVRVAPDLCATRIGEHICALVAGGGYAEYAAVPAVQCLAVPPGVSVQDAAVLPETFFTVYLNVVERGQLRAGETLLVHGGSSGIGTTAILLARALGARVFVTAGSARKCAACLSLGAERAINYREEDFVKVVREATDQRGVDVILDMVGGDYIARDIAALARDGRIALIATQGGARAEVDLGTVLVNRLTIAGATLRPQSVERKGRLAQALRAHIWPLFATHPLKPPIEARFPLGEAAAAHARLEAGEHIGKLVLDVQAGTA